MHVRKEWEGQDARREPSKERKQRPSEDEPGGNAELEALQSLSDKKQEVSSEGDNPAWCCY